MQRLLADAEKLSGIKYDISNLSDVYTAIHVIQQELGITGTTAEEASETISGSAGQLSAAWENLLTGIADANADLPKLIDDVVEVAEVALTNVMPTVEQALSGVARAVDKLAPIISDRLPALADDIIPPLLGAANTAVNALVQSLPMMLETVTDVVPEIITDISGTIIDMLPELASSGTEIIISLADGISDALPRLIPAAAEAVGELANELTNPKNIQKIVASGVQLIGSLIGGVLEAIPELIDAGLNAAGNLLEAIPGLSGFADFVREQKVLVEAAAAAFVIYKSAVAIGNVVSTTTSAISSLTSALATQATTLSAVVTASGGLGATLANLASAAGPYVALAGVVAGVAAEFVYWYDVIFEVSDEVKALQEEQEKLFETIDSGADIRETELDQVKRQADRYEELRTKVNRTYAEEAELADIASDLQAAFGDKIQVVDELTGEYNDLTGAVEQFIEAENRAAKMSAYKDRLTELYKMQADLEAQISDTQRQHQENLANPNLYDVVFDPNRAVENWNYNQDMQALHELQRENARYIEETNSLLAELYDEQGRAAATATETITDAFATESARAEKFSMQTVKDNAVQEINDTFDEIDGTIADRAAETGDFETLAIGEYVGLGVEQILGHTLTEAEEEADKIAETVFKASRDYVNRLTTANDLSYGDQIAWWQKIQGQFVEGSEQYLEAGDKVLELRKKQAAEFQKQEEAAAKAAAQSIRDTYNVGAAQIQHEVIVSGISYDEQIDRWETFLANFDPGSEYYNKIEEAIAKLISERDAAAYKLDLSQIESDLKYNRISYEDAIAQFEGLRAQFEENTEEYRQLTDKIDATKETAANAAYRTDLSQIESDLKYDRISFDDAIALLEEMQARYEENSEEYRNLADKIDEYTQKAEASAQQLIKDTYSENADRIKRDAKLNEWSYEQQISEWTQLLDDFEEYSDEWWKVTENIYDLQKKRDEEATKELKEQQEERKKSYDQYLDDIETIQKNIDAVQKNYDDTLTKRTQDIYNSYDLFSEVPERVLYSGKDLTRNLENQLLAIDKFYSDVEELSKRGVSTALVDEIRQMGVGAMDQLDALLDLSDEDLQQYNELYRQKNALSAQIAEDELAGLKVKTEDDITELLNDAAELTAEKSQTIGQEIAQGIADGITEGSPLILEAIASAVNVGDYKNIFAADESTAELYTPSETATVTVVKQETATRTENREQYRDIIVNINGIQYQNMTDLASAVGAEFQFLLGRATAGYSTA